MTKIKQINGTQIKEFSTINSMYANGCINAWSNGKMYKINVKELIKLINGVVFNKMKKTIHTYLEVNDEWLETHDWEEQQRMMI